MHSGSCQSTKIVHEQKFKEVVWEVLQAGRLVVYLSLCKRGIMLLQYTNAIHTKFDVLFGMFL